MLHTISILSIVALTAFFSGKDTSFVKIVYAGTRTVVPENEQWLVDKIFVSDGGEHNIKIANTHFKHNYQEKDTIKAPFYVPEMELLDDRSMVQYILYINSTKTQK